MERSISVGVLFAAFALVACASAREQESKNSEGTSTVPEDCAPQVLYEEFASLPTWVAVSNEHIFWTDERENILFRKSKRSSEPEIVSREVASGWEALAADADAVYVSRLDGMLHRISADDSRDVILAEAGGEWANQFRVQSGRLYWLSSNGNLSSENALVEVRRISVDGRGVSETLWRGNRASYGLAVQGDYLFVDEYTWPMSGRDPDANGVITRISVSGSPHMELASGLLFPRVHAVDEEFVYFSAQTADAERMNQLWRVGIDGGTAELVFDGADKGVNVGQMVAEGGTVWWGQTDDGQGLVRRVTPGSGTSAMTAMVASTHQMLGLAVDSEAFYFSSRFSDDDIGPGMIWRVARQCPVE